MRGLAASELHAVRGAVALADGRGRDAVVEFTQEDAAESCSLCALPDLARAYEQAGDVESAIAAYERYLERPWIWRFESDAPNLGWSRRRLGELYEQQREFGKAADQYARLLTLWKDADAQLAPTVADVRTRYARLRTAPSAP
jgi:tetratricopeptide (TPR) repeat protein